MFPSSSSKDPSPQSEDHIAPKQGFWPGQKAYYALRSRGESASDHASGLHGRDEDNFLGVDIKGMDTSREDNELTSDASDESQEKSAYARLRDTDHKAAMMYDFREYISSLESDDEEFEALQKFIKDPRRSYSEMVAKVSKYIEKNIRAAYEIVAYESKLKTPEDSMRIEHAVLSEFVTSCQLQQALDCFSEECHDEKLCSNQYAVLEYIQKHLTAIEAEATAVPAVPDALSPLAVFDNYFLRVKKHIDLRSHLENQFYVLIVLPEAKVQQSLAVLATNIKAQYTRADINIAVNLMQHMTDALRKMQKITEMTAEKSLLIQLQIYQLSQEIRAQLRREESDLEAFRQQLVALIKKNSQIIIESYPQSLSEGLRPEIAAQDLLQILESYHQTAPKANDEDPDVHCNDFQEECAQIKSLPEGGTAIDDKDSNLGQSFVQRIKNLETKWSRHSGRELRGDLTTSPCNRRAVDTALAETIVVLYAQHHYCIPDEDATRANFEPFINDLVSCIEDTAKRAEVIEQIARLKHAVYAWTAEKKSASSILSDLHYNAEHDCYVSSEIYSHALIEQHLDEIEQYIVDHDNFKQRSSPAQKKEVPSLNEKIVSQFNHLRVKRWLQATNKIKKALNDLKNLTPDGSSDEFIGNSHIKLSAIERQLREESSLRTIMPGVQSGSFKKEIKDCAILIADRLENRIEVLGNEFIKGPQLINREYNNALAKVEALTAFELQSSFYRGPQILCSAQNLQARIDHEHAIVSLVNHFVFELRKTLCTRGSFQEKLFYNHLFSNHWRNNIKDFPDFERVAQRMEMTKEELGEYLNLYFRGNSEENIIRQNEFKKQFTKILATRVEAPLQDLKVRWCFPASANKPYDKALLEKMDSEINAFLKRASENSWKYHGFPMIHAHDSMDQQKEFINNPLERDLRGVVDVYQKMLEHRYAQLQVLGISYQNAPKFKPKYGSLSTGDLRLYTVRYNNGGIELQAPSKLSLAFVMQRINLLLMKLQEIIKTIRNRGKIKEDSPDVVIDIVKRNKPMFFAVSPTNKQYECISKRKPQ